MSSFCCCCLRKCLTCSPGILRSGGDASELAAAYFGLIIPTTHESSAASRWTQCSVSFYLCAANQPDCSALCTLFYSCVASFALGEWIEGLAVIIIVLLNATIAVVTERGANEALKKLSGLSQASTHVRRDGKVQSLSTRELVPGDVVVLGVGDVVPADIRLLRANDMKVNEMLLTGEAIDVRKNGEVISRTTGDDSKVETLTPANEVFSSTTVVNGSGEGIVVATGMNTRVGRIAALVQQGTFAPIHHHRRLGSAPNNPTINTGCYTFPRRRHLPKH